MLSDLAVSYISGTLNTVQLLLQGLKFIGFSKSMIEKIRYTKKFLDMGILIYRIFLCLSENFHHLSNLLS